MYKPGYAFIDSMQIIIIITELNAALEQGYRVSKLYRVLEWEESSNEIFRDYIATFMALKIHSSSFPKGVNTPEEEDRFIRECWEKFGIRIFKDKMKFNASMRLLAKLVFYNHF